MKNRWLIAASAVGIHISIGSIYAWSVVTKPIMAEFSWSLKQVSFTFSIAIFFLGLSAAFFGRFVETKGPRQSGSLAALFFGIGLFGAALSLKFHSLIMLYLTYGMLGGIGLGIGYITPVSTLIKWFPERRGLATGIAIMGFGFAALIAGPIMQKLINSIGLINMFLVLGTVYFTLIFFSAQYLAPPPPDWVPSAYNNKFKTGGIKINSDLAQLTAAQAIKTPRFYYLWLMFFINITCGIAIISAASPMAQEIAHMTPMAAATMVGFVGLFNGMGRIGWSSLSDHLGRPAVWKTFFIIQMAAFILLPNIGQTLLFQLIIFLIVTCYGGGFASAPAYISDIFGTKEVSAILGYLLTAWAAAGIAGPMLSAWIRQTTGNYTKTLYIFSGLFAIAFTISLMMLNNIKKLRTAAN